MKTPLNVNFCKLSKITSIFFFGAAFALAASEAPRRIKSNIDDSHTAEIKGHVRPALAIAQDTGPVDGSKPLSRMSMHFALSAAQEADLNQFLKDVQDPTSKNFHKFLTPEAYGARFGMNSSDLEKVTLWLQQKGFGNIETARSKTFVTFSGTAAQAEAAFNTRLRNYQVKGEAHFANATNPQVPKTLNGIVAHIRGLHDFRPKPHAVLRPHYTSSITGNHFLAPDDWATMYDVQALYNAGYNGTGVNLVVIGQSDVHAADIQAFRSAAGLSNTQPNVIHVGTDPGYVAGDESESDLDLEWAGGIAKNANIIFVVGNPNIANGVDDAVTYAIDNNLGSVLSTSYGICEQGLAASDFASQEAQFKQANAQGMTIVAAAGDGGAADCDTAYPARQGFAVDYPSASQYVTGVGGTTLNDTSSNWNTTNDSYGGSATGYIPELVWNITSVGNGLAASGGGASILTAKPSWQTGTGVPNDGARDVPDLAAPADPSHVGLLICSSDTQVAANGNGPCVNGFRDSNLNLDPLGGTSAGAPTIAGLVALLVQKTGNPQGNINSRLYALASSAPSAFHDITSGNNIVPCRSGSTSCPASLQFGYSAGTGYDQTTGLGSLDANNLFAAWPDFGVAPSPATLTITHGTSGTSTVTVSPANGFSGSVSLSCAVSNTLANVTCSIPSTPNAGKATLTITAAANAALPLRIPPPNVPRNGIWYLAAATVLLAMAFFLRQRKSGRNFYAAAWACSFLLLALVACGGGSSSGSGGGGSTNVSVPNFVGLTQASASSSISAAGLATGTITTQTSSTVASGTVISQSPAAGTSVAPGTAVNLVVSSGPAPRTGTVTVTATTSAGGGFSKTTSIAVTVQ